jgi:hypothetical protein
MSKEGIDLLNRGSTKGKTLEYRGKWGAFNVAVILKRIDAAPDLFMLSIESPFFNVQRELVKKDVLDEVKKVLDFLEYEPKGDKKK